jgi:hydrogenase expression/formation protein HypE
MSAVRRSYTRPLDVKHGRIDLSHGSGGRATAQLVEELFIRHLDNPWLRTHDDSACFQPPPGRLVMTTDSHVITPLFFPGGDIGCLAVNGTINDVAMAGAKPLYLAAGFILEEGFPLAELERIVASMAQAARAARVPVIAGDTKVVEHGKGDGLYLTTTGVGVIPTGVEIGGARARIGDVAIVSGDVGDHGVAILAQREHLQFESEIRSDTAALHELVAVMLAACPNIRCLRDPTRGGLATTLNEIAQQSGVGMLLQEAAIPIAPMVAAACEFLGLDPLYSANEGKLVAVCPPGDAQRLLGAMREHPMGARAAAIGVCVADDSHFVQMETRLGGRRVVDWLSGEQLPRIC